MSDLADRKAIKLACCEERGKTRFSQFAERVLPTLRTLRSARRAAESLAGEGAPPAVERIGRFALESLRSIDATLRTTGVYDLSRLPMLENDAARMNGLCCVLDEVGERLRALAHVIAQHAMQTGDARTAVQFDSLLAVLRTPAHADPDGKRRLASPVLRRRE